MRIKLQDLQGSTRSAPSASPQDTFAIKGFGQLQAGAPVAPELLDFRSLSSSLQRQFDERKEFKDDAFEAAGARYQDAIERGATADEALKAATEDGKTPRRIASELAKSVRNGNLDEVDNPAFIMGLERRKAHALAQSMQRQGRDKIEQFAAEMANITDPAQKEAKIGEMLASLHEDNQEALDGLGYFGTRAIEESLLRVNGNLAAELDDRARAVVKENYRLLAGATFEAHGDAYLEAVTSDEKLDAAKAIGEEYDRINQEGLKNPGEFFTRRVLGMAARMEHTKGAQAAADMLEDLQENARNGQGRQIFKEIAGDEVEGHIGRLKRRAETEKEAEGIKAGQRRSEAVHKLYGSEVFEEMYEASQGGPDSLTAYVANLRGELEDNPEATIERLGLDPESAEYALSSILAIKQDLTTSANAAKKDLDENFEGSVIEAARSQGAGAAKALIYAQAKSLGAEETVRLSRLAEQLDNGTFRQNEAAIRQEPYRSTLQTMVGRAYDTESPIGALEAQREALDLESEFVKFYSNAIAGREDIITGQDAKALLKSFVDSKRDAYPVWTDSGVVRPQGGESLGDAATRVERQALERDSRGSWTSGQFVGGLSPDTVESDSTRRVLERITETSLGTGHWSLMTSIRSLEDSDLTDSQLNDVALDAITMTGSLSLSDIRSLERGPEGVMTALEKDGQWKEEFASPKAVARLKALTGVTLADINVYQARFTDFKEARKYLSMGGLGGTEVDISPDMPDLMKAQAVAILKEYGISEPTKKDLSAFFTSQTLNWR